MARLIGGQMVTSTEARAMRFINEILPDYIYAAFEPDIRIDNGDNIRIDALLLIPHMGCFILNINGAAKVSYENGKYFFINPFGHKREIPAERKRNQLLRQKHKVRLFFKQKFNFTPLVYEIDCYPNFEISDELLSSGSFPLDLDHMLWGDDFRSKDAFLLKLFKWMLKSSSSAEGSEPYNDLTDDIAYRIYSCWDKGIEPPKRPAKPPLVFLSYNELNQVRAGEFKKELENRGVFVWRAPEDVGAGDYYLEEEMEAIRECDLFVVLLSPSAQQSNEVRVEFEAALAMGKAIIPILIDDFPLNDYYTRALRKIQYRIMIEKDLAVFDEIVRAANRQKGE